MVVAQLPLGEATAQKTLSFPSADGGVVYANPFGKSDKDVLLAHGGQFNKESWTHRLTLWWRQDLKCWRSIFAGTASRKARAIPIR